MQINSKKDFRERILKLLRSQQEEKRIDKSLVIRDKLLELSEFKGAITILFYAAFDGEVITFEMMKESQKLGKNIGLPKIDKINRKIIPTLIDHVDKDLEEGPYGIQQPAHSTNRMLNLDEIDMIIVPGVAFDKNNNRLGRGQGYYDRLLGNLPKTIPTVGLAFDFQIVDTLPQQEEHDIPVSQVLTN